MVAIRLARYGTNKKPFFQIVVADKTSPRNGRVLEKLGYYEPLKKENNVVLKMDRIKYWMEKGAQPTLVVKSFLKKLSYKNSRGGGK